MSHKCPICKSDTVRPPETFQSSASGVHGQTYSCPKCGDYRLDSFAGAQLEARLDNSKQKTGVLSHWIRSRHEAVVAGELNSRELIILTDELVANIIDQPVPSPVEQADKFVLWLGNSRHPPGELVLVQPATHQSIMGATTPRGFKLVIDDLLRSGFLAPVASSEPEGRAKVFLSIQGWRRYDELKRVSADSRRAFMAMEYGHTDLESLFQDVWKPAVKQTGFNLFILPERPKAGLIDDRLRVEIRTSRFLIADLTHENRGAYWEAGYAEGLGRPVIYMCEKRKFKKRKTHFDTNHHETVLWDPESPQEAAEKLKITIRAELPAEAKQTDD